MSTDYSKLKPVHDFFEWQPCANALNPHAAGGSLCNDLRNNETRDPHIWQYASATVFNAYSLKGNEWQFIGSPAMGTFAAGACCCFVASAGPAGTLAAGWSTTQGALTTALPAAVGINQLANRGDDIGFRIRITGNAAGSPSSSGKTEERTIVGNTAGTTPTITLDSALSFKPEAGDRYEIMSGRVFMLATAAGVMKWYDLATNSFSAALNVTNLTTPATDTAMCVLDELYVPSNRAPGEGFFGEMTATGVTNVTNATVTGTSAAADASLQASEYANFQIRITEDTAQPTAVGQRKKITSHTAANPTVYTLSGTFAVQPSNTAKYVVEGIGDLIVRTAAGALCHTYAAGGWRADGAWSTGVTNGASAALQIPAAPANTAAGICMQWAFSCDTAEVDPAKNFRYSGVYLLRGGNVATMDVLDLATLSWSTGIGGTAVAYGGSGTLFTTGTSWILDPASNDGEYIYLNINPAAAITRMARMDLKCRTLEAWGNNRLFQGAAAVGNRVACGVVVDGATKGTYVYLLGASQNNWQRCLVTRP